MEHADEVKQRVTDALTRAGWRIERVIDPALVIEGHAMPVVDVHASHKERELRALVVLLLTAEPRAEAFAALGTSSPAVASRPFPASLATVRAQVHDMRAARNAARSVGAALATIEFPTLDQTTRALEASGWTIDRASSTFIDEPTWEIHGTDRSALLRADVGFRGNAELLPSEMQVKDTVGHSVLVSTRHASAFVRPGLSRVPRRCWT